MAKDFVCSVTYGCIVYEIKSQLNSSVHVCIIKKKCVCVVCYKCRNLYNLNLGTLG